MKTCLDCRSCKKRPKKYRQNNRVCARFLSGVWADKYAEICNKFEPRFELPLSEPPRKPMADELL